MKDRDQTIKLSIIILIIDFLINIQVDIRMKILIFSSLGIEIPYVFLP